MKESQAARETRQEAKLLWEEIRGYPTEPMDSIAIVLARARRILRELREAQNRDGPVAFAVRELIDQRLDEREKDSTR